MPYSCELKITDGCLRATTTGSFSSLEEAQEYLDMLRAQALEHGVKKVFLDERGLVEDQDAHDVHIISEFESVVLAALKGIRVVCLCHPDNFELNKLYETFLANRSVVFKVFLDEKEAMTWLYA